MNWREPEKSFVTICRHMEWAKVSNRGVETRSGLQKLGINGWQKSAPAVPGIVRSPEEALFCGSERLGVKRQVEPFS